MIFYINVQILKFLVRVDKSFNIGVVNIGSEGNIGRRLSFDMSLKKS